MNPVKPDMGGEFCPGMALSVCGFLLSWWLFPCDMMGHETPEERFC